MNLITQTMPFYQDAVHLLEIFKDEPNLFFLDSSLSESEDGRFCYLGFAPFKTIQVKDLDQLRKAVKPYLGLKSNLSFPAGALGTIGYDGSLYFGFYEGLLCLDLHQKILTVTSTGLPYKDLKRQRQVAYQRIEYILFKLQKSSFAASSPKVFRGKLIIKSDMTEKQYTSAVQKALQHIHDGDIYQINLAHRLGVSVKQWQQYVHPVEIYKNLRSISPSAFSAYWDTGSKFILSSSPERFLKLTGTTVQVRPMKGTRPRGKSRQEDQANKQELLESAKEKAELLMVTDLERNDLGRVCDYGSVKVKVMRNIEEYSTVFQATSTVEGRLHKKLDQFDLLKSTFPSGSVTGTPKIESMKIIAQLEKTGRGLYTGALGYISFTGDMDFNVLIRTLFLEKDHISFYVGSGIVADSVAQKEYEETILKSKAMVEALKKSFAL